MKTPKLKIQQAPLLQEVGLGAHTCCSTGFRGKWTDV